MKKGAVKERVIALRFPQPLSDEEFLALKDGLHQYNQERDVGARKYQFLSYPFVNRLPDPAENDGQIDWSKTEVGVNQRSKFIYNDGLYIQLFNDAITFNLVEKECLLNSSFSLLQDFYRKFGDFFDSYESIVSRAVVLELSYLNHWNNQDLRPFLSEDGRSLELASFMASGILGKDSTFFRPVIPFRQQRTYECVDENYRKITLRVETAIPISRDGKFTFDANLLASGTIAPSKENTWGLNGVLSRLHDIVTKGYEQLLTSKALELFKEESA